LEENTEEDNYELLRFYARLKVYILELTSYVRLLMPSWMEWKVFKDPITYLPPELGGFGLPVPGGFNIKEYEPAKDIAHRYFLAKNDPKWSTSVTGWERGVTITNILVNRLIQDGVIENTMTQDEVIEEADSTISSRTGDGSTRLTISNYTRWNFIRDEYYNLSKEIPIVTSKENAYVSLAIHPAIPEIIKKTRSRQLIGSIRKQLSKVHVPSDSTYDWQVPRPEARFIKASTLRTALNTNFVRPSLNISTRFFSLHPEVSGTWVQNVEEVRDTEKPGSFEIDLDESHRLSGTSSSTY
jgi:hypothetical protein